MHAKNLIVQYTQLGLWLEKQLHNPNSRFYIGFLFALEQILLLKHEIAKLPGEKISLKDFMQSWKQTARKLGLV